MLCEAKAAEPGPRPRHGRSRSQGAVIPLAIPNLGPGEAANLLECIESNWVSAIGPFVDRFEREVAEISGAACGVAVAAGTMGLHVALIALGVGPGDLVIVPSFTFIASANAISHAGAIPWLVDIAPSDWAMAPGALAAMLESETARDAEGTLRRRACGRRVAAIMPVYVLGTPADMDAIDAVATAFDLPILADAAAAIGATYKRRPLGGLARLTVYSFNGNKTITTGGGGMVIGNDRRLVDLVRHLATTARTGPDYDHDMIGYNYRLTNVEAAIGVAQLSRLPQFIAAKTRIRRAYDEAFCGRRDVSPFPDPDRGTSAYWFSGVVLDHSCRWTVRELCAELHAAGIQARPFWKPIHLQAPYLDAPRAPLPVTEATWPRVLTLPCSTSLCEDDQQFVIEAVSAALDSRA